MRKSIYLLFDLVWYEAIKELPEYERTEMYEAIFEYALTDKQPEGLKGADLALWKVISDRILIQEGREQSGTESEEYHE